ncbi:type II secretion system protein M [Paraneptunicella aestuarii]|uniref:type II secretion system protein GspM n=1 Tax=Paraneptunicella aestuarii TaxID=2831148 RepID=UPI001E37E50E|nr:type II secretion system protein M [Paraneptunicella aestuarii]UAA38906.1 type II secretion system protein M [Paraneptunicella aestuarii]
MEQLLEKYRALNERERTLTIAAGIMLVVSIFYFGIWSPMQQSLKTNKAAVASQTELLEWVEQSANRAIQLKQSSGSNRTFNGSLPQTVNQTAARFNIAITRMQPQGDEIQVWVDKAPFNEVLKWLQQMEQQGINIAEADLAESDEPGMIKIRRLRLSK